MTGAGRRFKGCATKKYVQNTAAPIQAKVDQVGERTNRNGQSIEDTPRPAESRLIEKCLQRWHQCGGRNARGDMPRISTAAIGRLAQTRWRAAMSSADKRQQAGREELDGLDHRLRKYLRRIAFANIDDHKWKIAGGGSGSRSTRLT